VAKKKTNPNRVRPRVKSARSRIEKTADISKTEMSWYKGKLGELRPSATNRFSKIVLSEFPQKGDKSFTHTHIRHDSKSGNIFPSDGDLRKFLAFAPETSIKIYHIVSISKKGEVLGYVSFKATKRLITNIQDAKRLLRKFKGSDSHLENNKIREIVFQDLKDLGLKAKIRCRPGYKFENGFFVKK
jgi:hypothetical protein